jgi:hypothetical protein
MGSYTIVPEPVKRERTASAVRLKRLVDSVKVCLCVCVRERVCERDSEHAARLLSIVIE